MKDYVYSVIFDGCNDLNDDFDILDTAIEYARQHIECKPIIQQVEIERNDFGECVNAGEPETVWEYSSEDKPNDVTEDLDEHRPEDKYDFEAMLEALEDYEGADFPDYDYGDEEATDDIFAENPEETVKCGWCGEEFPISECRHEHDLGYICPQCEAAIKSHGEPLAFDEDLDEDTHAKYAKPEGDRIKAYNNALKYAKKENKPFIYGYTAKSDNTDSGIKFFALDIPSDKDETAFKAQYKNCNTIYRVYPDKDFIDEDFTGTPEERTDHLEYVDKDVMDGEFELPDNISKKVGDACKKAPVVLHSEDDKKELNEDTNIQSVIDGIVNSFAASGGSAKTESSEDVFDVEW